MLRRLHDKGLIDDPVGRAKSVAFTADALQLTEALFERLFTRAA